MKRLGNPWFLLVAGMAGLVAYAKFGSPLEMAAIGVPFFVVLVGSSMLTRYGNAASWESKRECPGFVVMLWLALGLAGLAYLTWGFFTDTGLIGWLNAIQARRGGGYDEKLSAITAMLYLLFAMGASFVPLSRLGRLRPAAADASIPSKSNAAPSQRVTITRRTVLLCELGAIVLTWVAGYGIYEYYTMRNRGEMHATYLPVDVAAVPDAAAHAEFVALRGKVHPQGYLSLHTEHSDNATYFLPMVTPGAHDPLVHWVVQMDHHDFARMTLPVHAHAVGGTVTLTQREAFDRMGVHVANDAVLVSYVPANSTGEVIDESGEYWMFFLIGSGTVSLVLLMTFIALAVSQRIQGRRAGNAVAL